MGEMTALSVSIPSCGVGRGVSGVVCSQPGLVVTTTI